MERQTIPTNEIQQQIQFQISLLNLVERGSEEQARAAQRMAELAQIASR